ncbi:unnamed protein product [Adineta ricciae]|uniref:F-box domain-containing protein n=1 Tax=Adineta ricciae TaxID=249248 RepID=A0A814INI5_ADIRI|nr:unnamed protein product [Adineta ricciae]CAF1335502.1 unnamed protein product [Adineta ricciae]
MTCFEDLSNEIFYEIIEYLDICDAYAVFSKLNRRFQQFFKYLSLPWKFSIHSASRVSLSERCQYIRSKPVADILSLRFSNPTAVDYVLSLIPLDSSFIRLESLVLHKVNLLKLVSILTTLSTLPRLFSLTATMVGAITFLRDVHDALLALPVLKYCNTTFNGKIEFLELANLCAKISPIEYFVSRTSYTVKNVTDIFRHLPKLVHAEVSCFSPMFSTDSLMPLLVKHLTCLHLQTSTQVEQLEVFLSKLCHQIQILRISSYSKMDSTDAKRWQRLISSHFPDLRTFEMQHFGEISSLNEYDLIRNEFNSSFWWKRKWFFTFQTFNTNNTFYMLFYSQMRASSTRDARSIHNITIDDAKTIIEFQSSQLTFFPAYQNSGNASLFHQILNTMPYQQLKRLTITSNTCMMDNLIDWLNLCTNIEVLTFKTYYYSKKTCSCIIPRIIFQTLLTYENVQDLIDTFPRLEILEMKIRENDLENIVRFLLTYTHDEISRLYSIIIHDAHSILSGRLHKQIEREDFNWICSVEFIGDVLYLRWK